MTREEYMAKLKKHLRKLPKQDYEDAIEYFNEVSNSNQFFVKEKNKYLEAQS